MARNPPITEQRTTSRNLRVLAHLFGFLRPYRKNFLASAAGVVYCRRGAARVWGGAVTAVQHAGVFVGLRGLSPTYVAALLMRRAWG